MIRENGQGRECPNLSQGRALLRAVSLGQRTQNQGALQKRERAMAIFEGPDRNKNIMIAVAVLVVAVIAILYAAGRLPGI
jgi:hypothetical protein